jgi:hypothetical protein
VRAALKRWRSQRCPENGTSSPRAAVPAGSIPAEWHRLRDYPLALGDTGASRRKSRELMLVVACCGRSRVIGLETCSSPIRSTADQ